MDYDRLLITTWGHDPGVIATSNILLTLNDALSHSAILVQAHGWQSEGKTVHIPFPLDKTTGAFSKRHYHNHSAIIKLSKQADLEHFCGYITLLNTGRESRSIWKHEEDDLDLNTNCNINIRGSETSSVHSGDSGLLLDSPSNGLKDKTSAEMLATEIDLLDTECFENRDYSGNARDQLNLDLKQAEDENEILVEEEWNLLECYFGIPLFESSINKQTCEKIVSNGLCNADSLQELLCSSRKLSLKLLNFIARCQEMPMGSNKPLQVNDSLDQSASSKDHIATGKDQSTPYPTKSLIFAGGTLKLWNGH